MRMSLPRQDAGGPIALGDDVVLACFKLKPGAEGDIQLQAKGAGELPGTASRLRSVSTRFTGTSVTGEPKQHAGKCGDHRSSSGPFQPSAFGSGSAI